MRQIRSLTRCGSRNPPNGSRQDANLQAGSAPRVENDLPSPTGDHIVSVGPASLTIAPADSQTHTPHPAEPRTVRRSRAQRQRDFLAAFRDRGIVRDAAAEAGIDRSAHYRWLAEDQAYRDAFASVEEDACDLLEAEARRRAVDGWAEPVFGKGEGAHAGVKVVGYVRQYSDRLLEVLLKGRRRHVFGNLDKRLVHVGPEGGPVELNHATPEVRILPSR